MGEELTMMDRRMAIALAMLAPLGAGTAQEMIAPEGDVAPVHDPVVIKEKGVYYVFCSGSSSPSIAAAAAPRARTTSWSDARPRSPGRTWTKPASR